MSTHILVTGYFDIRPCNNATNLCGIVTWSDIKTSSDQNMSRHYSQNLDGTFNIDLIVFIHHEEYHNM